MPDNRSYSLHLPFYHHDDNKNLRLLYGVRVARDLVSHICFFFYPIFLFKFSQSFTLLQIFHLDPISTGMIGIALYFLLVRVLMFFIGIPIGHVIQRAGVSMGLVYAFAFRCLQLLLLTKVETYPWLIAVIILFEATQSHFFWNSYYTILSKFTLKQNMGKDLGLQQFLLQLFSAAAPAISGAIIYRSGFDAVFLIGVLLCLVGVILSLLMSIPLFQDKISLHEFFQWFKEKQYERFAISYTGKYINDSIYFLWPLYVFFFLGSVDRVGFLYTLSLFIALVFAFIFGSMVDNNTSRKPFVASGGLLSLLWIFRTHFLNPWVIGFIDAADRLMGSYHWLFFDSLFIKRGKGHRALAYFVYSELVLSVIGSCLWLVITLLFYFQVGWTAVFLVGAVGVLASLGMKEEHLTHDHSVKL